MNTLDKKIALLLLFVVTTVSAQVGLGTRTPHPDAMLELAATNKGILLPRVALVSSTAVAPLTAHVAGMSVYNTATAGDVTPGYYYNDGSKWVKLATGAVPTDATANSNGLIRLAGDLAGTATAPTVKDDAITSSKLADDAVTAIKIKDDAVTLAKIDATGTADATTFLRGDGAWVETASVLKGTVTTDGTASSYTISNTKITTNSIVTVSYYNTANEIISHAITSVATGSFKVQFAATPAGGGKIFYTIVN